ncbi:MAG TPA: hypothetical protein VF384_01400 [Planctomycetota bacterium]
MDRMYGQLPSLAAGVPLLLASSLALLCPTASGQCNQSQGNASLQLLGHPAELNLVRLSTSGAANAPAMLLVDPVAGPTASPFGTFCVGLSPALVGLLRLTNGGGTDKLTFGIPVLPGLPGTSYYFQSLVLDALAPNGGFALSNGVALAVHPSTLLFAEDFETYATGLSPTGGWVQYWGGPQIIVNPGPASAQCLELHGAYCWSAVAYRPVPNLVGNVRLEFSASVPHLSPAGCGSDMCFFGFWNPPGGGCTWGCAHDFFQFVSNGTILVSGATLPLLVQVDHWYRIAIQADFTAGSFVLEIDGQLFGPFAGSQTQPAGIAFYAGHGAGPNPVLRLDDIRVMSQ